MRLLFDLKKIKGVFNYKGRIRLRLKVFLFSIQIGDVVSISSELSSYNQGNYAFLQKQIVKMDRVGDQLYVEISIVAESGVLLSQITVFFAKLVSEKTTQKDLDMIALKNNNEVYQVYFSLTEIADDEDEMVPGLLARKSTKVEQKLENQKESKGRLQILRLGFLIFEFSQRLDPLIYLYHWTIDLFCWKNPYNTIAMGILLTMVIYNLKISILVAGLLLYFGKDFLFKKIQKLSKYKNIHKRLIVPQENAYFLQHSMDNYCLAYQKISQFLFSEDKTLLINIISLLCKMGTFLIVLLFFFGVEHLTVIGLWTILFLASPYRNNVLKYTQPFIEFVAGQYSKIVDKISSGIFNVLGSNSNEAYYEIQKEFYFYKYQRWWVLKGWADQNKKFSDEDYNCIIAPKEDAPEGWAWIEEWKIDFSGEVDSDGYQYCNDIKVQFTSNSSLATRRRRKWKRACTKLKE